jgi:hypothetical protein
VTEGGARLLSCGYQALGERHDFEEWQETMSTLLINLAAASADESARFASMSRHVYEIPENVSRKLELAYNREALRICNDE